jgi:hypothetical protein
MKKPKKIRLLATIFYFAKFHQNVKFFWRVATILKVFFLSFEKNSLKNMVFGFGFPYLEHLDCQITTRLQF